jgi:hypothetical protein
MSDYARLAPAANVHCGQREGQLMLGLFLEPDAPARLTAAPLDPVVKLNALEVVLRWGR